MTLATRCPSCQTVFRLSKDHASSHGGMVCCGICGETFNALNYLIAERDLSGLGVLAGGDDEPESPPGIQTRQFELPMPSQPQPAGQADRKREPVMSRKDSEPSPQAQPVPDEVVAAPRASSMFLKSISERERDSWIGRLAWGLLALLGCVTLAGQAAYVWRDQLAAREPELVPFLEQACIGLHCHIDLPSDIEQIAIESSDLQSVPGAHDTYAFTTLLRSHDVYPVRLPAIELTLTDTADHALLRKVFVPGEYLNGAQKDRANVGIAPNGELLVKVVFEANGIKAAGFRTGVFFP
jgi:predicted Zn finger-like uncharacterized protein